MNMEQPFRLPSGRQAITAYREADAQLRHLPADAKLAGRKRLRSARRALVTTFAQETLGRALHEHHDGPESLVWFWFNHFNIFWKKSLAGVGLPDYVDGLIRPNAQGRFPDLLSGVLTHPAMLVYLDNTRNVAGRINENLARELLELHTLGVEGGYQQADVREVARVLTGLGLRPLRMQGHTAGSVQSGEFMFNPRLHERGAKRVLGRKIEAEGFGEIRALVDLLSTHPATARHVAGKLCLYMRGDRVSQKCVAESAEVFHRSGGDIGKTVAFIRAWALPDAERNPGTFKDAYRYVTSAVRFCTPGLDVKNLQPVLRWLSALGQPLFGCRTPDGYSLRGADWLNPGQLTLRFEIAREVVQALPRLVGMPLTADAVLRHAAVQAFSDSLAMASRNAIEKAQAADERLALLLCSPEFMHWQPENAA